MALGGAVMVANWCHWGNGHHSGLPMILRIITKVCVSIRDLNHQCYICNTIAASCFVLTAVELPHPQRRLLLANGSLPGVRETDPGFGSILGPSLSALSPGPWSFGRAYQAETAPDNRTLSLSLDHNNVSLRHPQVNRSLIWIKIGKEQYPATIKYSEFLHVRISLKLLPL